MHELTIARSLVELADGHARRNGASRVCRVHVRLGLLAGIVRSLHFAFEPAAFGTLCEGAELDIEEVPLSVHCPACDAVKMPRALYDFRCPDCGSPTPQVLTGREMDLVALELDIGDPPAPSEPDTSTGRAANALPAKQNGHLSSPRGGEIVDQAIERPTGT
jgi:hydrogenase nickel incorporation protein HypA/HybF